MQDLLTKTDEELMLLAGKGEKKAFEQIMIRHSRHLTNYFYKLLRNTEDAKDFTQLTFVKIFETAKKYRPLAKFTTWMFTIAHNIYINEIVRRQKVKFTDLDNVRGLATAGSTVEEEVSKKDTAELVRNIVNALPQEYKDVVLLQVYEGLKCGEIAKILKVPEGTVWSRFHYALKMMKDEFIKKAGKNAL